MFTFDSVSTNDFAAMDDDALAAAVSTLAAHIHAATYRLLVLIAELDRREVWAAQGALSCAHWLSLGLWHRHPHRAREGSGCPGIDRAAATLRGARQGRTRLLQGPALTRIATSENEDDLLNIGLHGTAQHVEKFVRLYRRAKRAEETERPTPSTRTGASPSGTRTTAPWCCTDGSRPRWVRAS